MSEPSLATQNAIGTRLIAASSVTSLVPVERIFDRNIRPEIFPCVVIGEGQTVLEAITLHRHHVRVFSDLHMWTEEIGLENLKAISGAVQTALRPRLSIPGFQVIDWKIANTRYMRDPGELGHAVCTCEALLMESAYA